MLSEFNTFCGQYENIIKAFGALAPFFGTLFLAYIAYQQWQTNERKRRHELFAERYEFYSNILKFLKSFTENSPVIPVSQYKEIIQNINKNGYLIKQKDYNELFEYFNNLRSLDQKISSQEAEKIRGIISSMFEAYLAIEPKDTIWDILKRWIISIYEFLTPTWLQNFLSKQAKTSVILNLFQHLVKKEESTNKID